MEVRLLTANGFGTVCYNGDPGMFKLKRFEETIEDAIRE